MFRTQLRRTENAILLFLACSNAFAQTNFQWAMMKGPTELGAYEVTGTKSVAGSRNTPGGLEYAMSWTDNLGKLWVYGGVDTHGHTKDDLWKFDPSINQWTWMKGSSGDEFVSAVYGIYRVPGPSNTPGSRERAVTWTDRAGNLWLFGGYGRDSAGLYGKMDDLWRFSPATGQWTWMKGSTKHDQAPVHGTLGVAAENNTPGARTKSTAWVDSDGKFWLMGGKFGDIILHHVDHILHDLWTYDPISGNWTWIKGSAQFDASGVYGVRGISDAANKPGARVGAVGWCDKVNNIWLFGGYGYDAMGNQNSLNDLWRFSPTTGNWTWISGSSAVKQDGVYGQQGIGSIENVPGARRDAINWLDKTGNLWMFGGHDTDSYYSNRIFSDVWKFSPSAGNWIWMGGSSAVGQSGTFEIMGQIHPANQPGARRNAVAWTDPAGDFWLFGGSGYAASGVQNRLNDLWKYQPVTGQWAWMKGAYLLFPSGIYGVQGKPGTYNMPNGRSGAVGWTDPEGSLWLFGGDGRTATGYEGLMNDLWRYVPATGQWTWMAGSEYTNEAGNYGVRGVASARQTPGARRGAVAWTDPTGSLWLFGGSKDSAYREEKYFNDLWKFDRTTGRWTWMKGSSSPSQGGIYGTQGVATVNNAPGAREFASGWTDPTGKLWLFGGTGYSSNGFGELNDLWQFDPDINQWKWVKGSATNNQSGVYGSKGVAATANTPGSRHHAMAWADSNGTLWLFAGRHDVGAFFYTFNDLWNFNPLTNRWTWIKGDSTTDRGPVEGELGIPSPDNDPGSRWWSSTWTDADGNLWLYGGFLFYYGDPSRSSTWKFDTRTLNWTRMHPKSKTVEQNYDFEALGIRSIENHPGNRAGVVAWSDDHDGFWLSGNYQQGFASLSEVTVWRGYPDGDASSDDWLVYH